MAYIKMKYVHKFTSKGQDYYYFRKDGVRTKLPGKPGSVEFLTEYERLLGSPSHEVRAAAKGSFSDVAIEYLKCADFTELAPKSQKTYRRQIDRLRDVFGDSGIQIITRAHILAYRDAIADQPATCNAAMSVLSNVFAFAADRDLITHNPAGHIKRMRTGEYSAWSADAIEKFRNNAPDYLVWAMEVALWTGQRMGDCTNMQWNHIEHGVMHVKQGKTGAEVWVPLPKPLRDILATIPKKSTRILTSMTGKVWAENLSNAFGAESKRLGIPFVFHGLRKTTATALADAGCSAHEIQAITGHATIAQVQHYTKAADQKRLAKAAIVKLENATKT